MSVVIPSLKRAHLLLTRYIADSAIYKHSKATYQKALQIGNRVSSKVEIDIHLVSIGALLHDIGRALVHDVTHGYIGGKLLQQNGYPQNVVKIVERHVLGGFMSQDALQLGLPKRNFVPQTWEEKIVCVADKLGLYGWQKFVPPQKWLSQMNARLKRLTERYTVTKLYQRSMDRARQFAKELVALVLI